MFYSLLLLLVFHKSGFVLTASEAVDESDFGENLISSLKNDENLDLSVDEEYEDLRSELLAYHSALASVVDTRRSLKTAPCASAGGICINYKLCPGYRHITEIPGCKNDHSVCCFVWNMYEIRDHKEKGLPNLAYPWKTIQTEFGGKGIVDKKKSKNKKRRTKKEKPRTGEGSAVIVVAT